MKSKIIFVLTCFILVALAPVFVARAEIAEAFNANYIISDVELTDFASMSAKQIQQFLEIKESYLATYSTTDAEGVIRPASDIIWLAATTYKINPKYLLVLLQKEQSLITEPEPSQRRLDWATGYAVCDSCSTTDPIIQKFKGFGKQVDRAAWRNRYYIEHPNEFKWQVGETYQIDDQQVTIYNRATANLYIYTPHIHGNYNFWKLWNMWFTRRYPDGSVLKIEDEAGIWLIKNGQRRAFLSKSAFISRYDPNKVIVVGRNDLAQFEIGPPIKYPQYSLLQSPDQEIYLVVNDYIRHIESSEVFRQIGFNPEEIIEVEKEDLETYLAGDPITLKSIYPTGALLQNNTTGGVYFVENGRKHAIWARELLATNFKNIAIQAVDPEELLEYEIHEPVRFNDGELIKGDDAPTVYVISEGQKLPIASAEVFEEIGYRWENIIYTSSKVVNLHPPGLEINTFLETVVPSDIPQFEYQEDSTDSPTEEIETTDEQPNIPVSNINDELSIKAYK